MWGGGGGLFSCTSFSLLSLSEKIKEIMEKIEIACSKDNCEIMLKVKIKVKCLDVFSIK